MTTFTGPDRSGATMLLSKVPQVTLFFWLIKIMATTVGETAADYLMEHTGLTLVSTLWLSVGVLAALLAVQVRSARYVPARYWSTVVAISPDHSRSHLS